MRAIPSHRKVVRLFYGGLIGLCLFAFDSKLRAQTGEGAVKRGAAVFRASGGCGCHTRPELDGALLAGARPISTPFGVIYGSNITPDPQTGIGAFSDEDFIRAMRKGVSPKGGHYFPVFPYTSFAGMSRRDLLDLKAYLFSLPPIVQQNLPPEFAWPFGWRFNLIFWKWLFFRPAEFTPDKNKSTAWNRGAYLVRAVAHCSECHTPRDIFGSLRADLYLAGSIEGPEGELAPNITPDRETGIGDWATADIVWYLQTGFNPDGDDSQGLMAELIEDGYSKMPVGDLEAVATYLQSITPIRNRVRNEMVEE